VLYRYGIGSVVRLTALYVIFAPVNLGLALAGALVSARLCVVGLIAPLNELAALRLSAMRLSETFSSRTAYKRWAACSLPEVSMITNVGLPYLWVAATVCAWLWMNQNTFFVVWRSSVVIARSGASSAHCYLIFPGLPSQSIRIGFDSPMALFELM